MDLSSVDVGEEFTIRIDTFAKTYNRRGGGAVADCQASAVNAFLRDPQEIGGATIEISGLEPTNRPLPAPPDQVLVEPEACVPGPGPNADAGVLQFDAPSYAIDEFSGAVPTITVTRTGGSVGAVTATFTTSDGTAIGGTDYTPVNATVFFGDGDTGARVVTVPTIPNQVAHTRQDCESHTLAARRLRGLGRADHCSADDPRRRYRIAATTTATCLHDRRHGLGPWRRGSYAGAATAHDRRFHQRGRR